MAVFLAYGSPALGHLFPLAALLSELVERGHQVHLRTMSTGVAKAQAAGIYAELVDARIEAIVAPDWMARNALGVLKMTMTDGARRVAAGFAATGGVARGADLIEAHMRLPVARDVRE
jgi:UDP:flavonoid glycosyltransferase YjiC (YdhE family)